MSQSMRTPLLFAFVAVLFILEGTTKAKRSGVRIDWLIPTVL